MADGEIFDFGAEWFREVHHPKDIDRHLKKGMAAVFPFLKGFENRTDAGFFQQIGVLFEFPYLYANLSAVDNLNYFMSFYPKEQLRDVKNCWKNWNLRKTSLISRQSSYSKGCGSCVSMARAWISNPKLFILDEPTSGLDPAGAVLFRKSSRKNGKGINESFH